KKPLKIGKTKRTRMKTAMLFTKNSLVLVTIGVIAFLAGSWVVVRGQASTQPNLSTTRKPFVLVTRDNTISNAAEMVMQGRQIFRFDTYSDEAFWSDTLKLHQAIEGTNFGGVGPGVSPKTALGLGLKVDAEALPRNVIQGLQSGQLNLDSPAITLQLIKLNA